MKAILFSSIAAAALLVGCAAEQSDDVAQDDVTSRPRIELKNSNDPKAVQFKLYELLDAFKGERELGIFSAIDSPSLQMSGAKEPRVPIRTVTCTEARLGGGAAPHVSHACTLDAFDKIRNGGSLPGVLLKDEGEDPLAGKLFTLLEKGEKKGNLGVKKSTGGEPHCCDVPQTTTYSLSDAKTTLSCSLRTGGFVATRSVQCQVILSDGTPPAEQ